MVPRSISWPEKIQRIERGRYGCGLSHHPKMNMSGVESGKKKRMVDTPGRPSKLASPHKPEFKKMPLDLAAE